MCQSVSLCICFGKAKMVSGTKESLSVTLFNADDTYLMTHSPTKDGKLFWVIIRAVLFLSKIIAAAFIYDLRDAVQ